MYLPSIRSGDTVEKIVPYLGGLSSIRAECEEENVCVLGDFNCAACSGGFRDA